jgi:hypothetical protein
MTDFSLQMRRLALSPDEKTLTTCITIAATIAIALLAICLYRRHLANEAAKREAEQEKNKEFAVEIQEESTQESKDEVEDVEVALTESEEEEYDRSISLCRTGTMNSLDVHVCQSGSCDVCSKDEEPDFIQVKTIARGTEGRIRSLQGKWWERDYAEQEPLDTIISMSRSTDWEDESFLHNDSAVSDL